MFVIFPFIQILIIDCFRGGAGAGQDGESAVDVEGFLNKNARDVVWQRIDIGNQQVNAVDDIGEAEGLGELVLCEASSEHRKQQEGYEESAGKEAVNEDNLVIVGNVRADGETEEADREDADEQTPEEVFDTGVEHVNHDQCNDAEIADKENDGAQPVETDVATDGEFKITGVALE